VSVIFPPNALFYRPTALVWSLVYDMPVDKRNFVVLPQYPSFVLESAPKQTA
jgi:hypothetical protein